jgi:hypothetical protein
LIFIQEQFNGIWVVYPTNVMKMYWYRGRNEPPVVCSATLFCVLVVG